MHQQSNGEVTIPSALQPYLDGLERLRKPSKPFKIKWIKSKSPQNKKKSTWDEGKKKKRNKANRSPTNIGFVSILW